MVSAEIPIRYTFIFMCSWVNRAEPALLATNLIGAQMAKTCKTTMDDLYSSPNNIGIAQGASEMIIANANTPNVSIALVPIL